MAKFKISYFAKIRKFAPNEIPVSTAMWDPKWYHTPEKVYLDKRSVINGLRVDPFVPIGEDGSECPGPQACDAEPGYCRASISYKAQLSKLSYDEIISRFSDLERRLRQRFPHLAEYPELTFVFIVYEVPDNMCSERWTIREWFENNGHSLPEWEESAN